ncbi:YadA family autotransporter adhesin [Variovorax boronicumulans]|uniref:YadA family autotransporter adhesin n=1 Tax=Variovorax boronicumulans TaxID=436515 RepID=UPI0030B8DECB
MSTTNSSVGSLSTGLGATINTVNNLSTAITSISEKGSRYFRANSTAKDSDANGKEAVAIGPQSVASGDHSFAAGNGAKATANGAVAIGFGAQATGANAIAIGSGALATGSQAMGLDSRAGGGGAAFGDKADAGGTVLSKAHGISHGTAIGFKAVVTQSGGVALGAGSIASTAQGVAGYIPAGATMKEAAAIKATTSTLAAVSVGDAATGQFRQITGVAAGTADSDATNVGQLRAASSAIAAGSVQYDTNADGAVNYSQVTLGNGQAPNGTRISNIAPGVAPTDAVNLGQLTAAQSQLQGQISSTQRIAYSGVAMAIAMSSLPQAMSPEKTLLSLGVGSYSGYSALAIGYSSRSKNGKWVYKVNGSYSGQKVNLGIGVGYEFD